MSPQRFRPYPAYKDSGVEWLREIPAHWEAKPLKRLASLRAGAAITAESIDGTGELPVFGGNGLRGFTSSYTHEECFPFIGRQGALCGCVNFASGRFWASEHAVVAKPEGASRRRGPGALSQAFGVRDRAAGRPRCAAERGQGFGMSIQAGLFPAGARTERGVAAAARGEPVRGGAAAFGTSSSSGDHY
jgi:type I restriction enzyme, S subunit